MSNREADVSEGVLINHKERKVGEMSWSGSGPH